MKMWKKLLYQILSKPVELKTRKLIRSIWNRTSKIMMTALNLRQSADVLGSEGTEEIYAIIDEAHKIIGELTSLGDTLELRKQDASEEAEKRSRQGRCEHCE